MDKLVIFGDSSSLITSILLKSTLGVVKNRTDVIICCVVDASKIEPEQRTICRVFKSFALYVCAKIMNPGEAFSGGKVLRKNLYDICRKNKVSVIVPPNRNINDRGFVDYISSRLCPTMGLAIGCPQIIKQPLISVFDIMVNYHNSLLPLYKGLGATSWSIYFDEIETGFTLHIVNEDVDAGNVLIQEKISISNNRTSNEIEVEKTAKASRCIDKLLNMMVSREKGAQQNGQASYFGRKDLERIQTVENPREVTFAELSKRIRSFGQVRVNIGGEYFSVTRIKRLKETRRIRPPRFAAADNVVVIPTRVSHFPYRFYRMLRKIKHFWR